MVFECNDYFVIVEIIVSLDWCHFGILLSFGFFFCYWLFLAWIYFFAVGFDRVLVFCVFFLLKMFVAPSSFVIVIS